MTGYGKDVLTENNIQITTEVRTINHRYLDVKLHTPHSLIGLEDEIKKCVQSYFARGRIELFLKIEGEMVAPSYVDVDWSLLDQYIGKMNQVKDRYHLTGEIPIEIMITIPDLFIVNQREDFGDEIEHLLMLSIQHACEKAKSERNREGLNLKRDMQKRMKTIDNMVSSLEKSQIDVVKNYRERVKERIHAYVDDSVILDESRIHQEIALLAEKGDITEEIIRLKSHITHFMELFTRKNPVGRKLDFIVQEIHREINTIGSKSIDENMSRIIVEGKGELEKIREQIQNVE